MPSVPTNFFFTTLKDYNIFSGKHSAVGKPSLGSPTLSQVQNSWMDPEILVFWKVPWSVLREHGWLQRKTLLKHGS